MKEYNNEFKIIVNGLKAEYATCGSHKIELTINIDQEDIDKFLKQLNEN